MYEWVPVVSGPDFGTGSACGTVKAKLALSARIFTCEVCGLVIDRDLNAALSGPLPGTRGPRRDKTGTAAPQEAAAN